MIIIIILCFNLNDFAVDQKWPSPKWPSPPRPIVSILYHSFKSHWWNLLEVLTMVAAENGEQALPAISISHWAVAIHKFSAGLDDDFPECCWEMSHQYSVIDPLQKSFGRWNASSAFCTIRHPLIDQSLTHWWCNSSIVGLASDTDTPGMGSANARVIKDTNKLPIIN